MKQNKINLILLLLSMFALSSCASLGKMIRTMAGTESSTPVETKPKNAFSENKNYQAYPLPNRKYGHMNKDRFEEEAKVDASEGSLWVNEGQGSYLFTQNQRRLEGDVLNVNIEDAAEKQLSAKMTVISNLLKQRSAPAINRSIASVEGGGGTVAPTANAATDAAPAAGAASAAAAKTEDKKEEALDVKQIPTRVIAAYPDGSYRVKGSRSIMIEKKEFKVLVTGLVRGSDILDDGVASNKLLDSKFDIVSSKRGL